MTVSQEFSASETDTATGVGPDVEPGSSKTFAGKSGWGQRFSPGNISAVYVLAVIIVVFSFWAPNTFLAMATVKQVADGNFVNALAALALIIPLSCATFDLSFGYTMSLAGVIAARLVVHHNMNVELATFIAVIVCLSVGILNGLVVVVLKIDSFIGTLGTGFIVSALISEVTNNNPVQSSKLDGAFTSMSVHLLFGIRQAFWFAVILAVILWLFMEYSSTGRRLYAAGFNPDAARLAGIKVDRLRFGSLLASSAIAAFAGVMLASNISSGDPSGGTSYLLPAFAAVFVGATQFKRDRFNAWGTLLAVLMIGTGIVGLGLVSPKQWYQDVFEGVVLLAALAFNSFREQNLLQGSSNLLKRVLGRRRSVPVTQA